MKLALQTIGTLVVIIGGGVGLADMFSASAQIWHMDGLTDETEALLTGGLNKTIEWCVIGSLIFFSAYIKFQWPTYRIKPDPTIEAIMDARKAAREAKKEKISRVGI